VVEAVRSIGLVVGAILVFGSQGLRDAATAVGGLLGALLLVAVVGLMVLLILGMFVLGWSRREFFFDDAGDFRLDDGVVQRKERRVALSRLQSVDVVRPLLGRIVGLAQVRIEVAGGGDSRVVLSYLTEAQAQALRAELIARAAGVHPQAGEAPEVVLTAVPTSDLVVSLLLRSETMILIGFSLLVVAAVVATEGPAGLGLLLLTGGLPIVTVFTQFSRFFGFTVADSPDGLRLRHGLVSVENQTVPPGRVQALEIEEPLLWRRRGWVRVNLNVAGLQTGDQEGRTEHVLLPVAPREVAHDIIARVLPGVDLRAVALAPAPGRARRRAWLQWHNLGVGHDERVMVTSRGFLTRKVAVIPHARTQSVEVSQGPWQRRLGLASVQVDSTPGPVTVVALHREAGQARAIAEAQLVRAAAARGRAPHERWMSGPRATPAASEAAAGPPGEESGHPGQLP
jgi:putative membrane protein